MIRVKAVIFSSCVFLFGCTWVGSFIPDNREDYLEAKPGRAELIIPEGLDTGVIKDSWPIPDVESRPLAKTFPDKAPLPSLIFGGAVDEVIKIQKLGERRWIVAGDQPEIVWPVVKQFLADNGVRVAAEQPGLGLIVTDWMNVQPDESPSDVIRLVLRDNKKAQDRDLLMIRVEQGIRRGTSEIHLRHLSDKLGPLTSDWPSTSSMQTIEHEVLNEIAAYFAADVVAPSISRQGTQISTASKAALVRDDQGYLLLRFELDFERVWATLTKAMDAAEITVNEQIRSKATFAVTLDNLSLGEEPNFFQSVIPDFIPGIDVEGQKIDVVIKIYPDGDGHVVDVLNPDGTNLSVEVGDKIIVMLREFSA